MISDLPELSRLLFCVPVTTVTLQQVISGIQFFADRVPALELRLEKLPSSSWSNGIEDRFYSFERFSLPSYPDAVWCVGGAVCIQ